VEKSCGSCGRQFTAKRASARYCSDVCRQRAKRSRDSAPAPLPEADEPGPVERKVRADVEAMVTEHPAGEALAEMSYALARLLDNATGGMSAAAINRELRENLAELSRLAVDDGDELADELSAPELPA
jgi:hypothetical protein